MRNTRFTTKSQAETTPAFGKIQGFIMLSVIKERFIRSGFPLKNSKVPFELMLGAKSARNSPVPKYISIAISLR